MMKHPIHMHVLRSLVRHGRHFVAPRNRMSHGSQWLQEEAGYTSLEASVAAVLLVIVLVPLGAFAVHLVLDRQQRLYTEALSAAEAVIENASVYTPLGQDSLLDGRFLVRRTVTGTPHLRVVVVTVRRRAGTDRRTLVTLHTAFYHEGAP